MIAAEAAVRAALAEIPDPEMPVVSIVDLGLVEDVTVGVEGIRVELLPTFLGCPALELIERAVADRLAAFGAPVEVVVRRTVPWSSDRITALGRAALRAAGLAPPGPAPRAGSDPVGGVLVALGRPVPCPYCGSPRTVLESAFGPTQCRTVRHCTACRQPFEAIKPA